MVKSSLRRNATALGLMTVVLLGALVPSPVEGASSSDACRELVAEDKSYVVCTFNLATTRLQLHWKDPSGQPYGNVGTLARAMKAAGTPVAMALNAGMYHADSTPVGLYIERGEQAVRANTAPGPGNFHLKPNGVFYFTSTDAGVLETGRFLKTRPKADYATQSGPMLVIDGRLHPRISANGPSLKIRNGVGVRPSDGREGGKTVVFAISNEAVSFGDFARLFRDELQCPNALFLDGSISSLWAPSVNRSDEFWPAGPIVSARPK